MGGGVFVWAVESQKQIFGVVGNLRSSALAGWLAGRAQGLAQLISKFAQIHQQIIGGALQRKSG